MTTMLHSEFDYDTSSLKRAIKLGEAKPTPRGNGTMTIFPLGLPQETRDRLAHLSTMTGESQADHTPGHRQDSGTGSGRCHPHQ